MAVTPGRKRMRVTSFLFSSSCPRTSPLSLRSLPPYVAVVRAASSCCATSPRLRLFGHVLVLCPAVLQLLQTMKTIGRVCGVRVRVFVCVCVCVCVCGCVIVLLPWDSRKKNVQRRAS